VKGVRIVRDTVVVSIALAAASLLAGLVLGQLAIGLGVALGLGVGAANVELIERVISSRWPFVVSSIMRMAIISAAAIGLAFIFGTSQITLLLGVAAAQFVMVGVSVRQGLRT
jgi:hypothetical protein